MATKSVLRSRAASWATPVRPPIVPTAIEATAG